MSALMASVDVSTAEEITFWLLAPLMVLAAVMVVASRKAVHSALWMAMTMILLAVFYTMQGGVFLGVVQVVVYTGAVMMLFLFVLMLVGVDASDSFVETLRGHRAATTVIGIGFGFLLLSGVARATFPPTVGVGAANDAAGGHVRALAQIIYTHYIFGFEVISAVLIVAAVGAMALTHRTLLKARLTQSELSRLRTRSGRVTTLPSPGVYARHNAVDTPALLPDGTSAEDSVPEHLRRRGLVRPTGTVELPHGNDDGGAS
ncbi:MAG: NADH-quinone oxidoreductase subunit J [Actinomycetes bacterium]